MTVRNRWMAGALATVVLVGAAPLPLHAQSGSAAPDAPKQGVELQAHRPEVPFVNGLIASGHPLSSMAGTRILMAGGNAADAAVATMAVLNVVEPWASGMGGNGFLVYYDGATRRVESLSFAGAAPRAVKPGELTKEDKDVGMKAAIVPGAFGGWIALLQKHGSRSLAEVLAPALELAREGHPLDPSIAALIARNKTLPRFETSASVFLPNGKAPEARATMRFPELAGTLRRLVDAEAAALGKGGSRAEGLQAAYDHFYKAGLAEEMAAFYKANGGDLALADLQAYQPEWGEPIHVTYRGYDIYANPPTTRGGLEVLMQLKLLEGFDMAALGHNSAEALHLQAEAIKIAKSDIYAHVADPDEVDVPVAGLLSETYLDTRRALIDPARAIAFPEPGAPGSHRKAGLADTRPLDVAALPAAERWDTDGHTTSLSVMDKAGNVVVSTPTLGGGFGTGVVVGETGILLNNGMRLGSTAPYPGHINFVGPGRTPLLNNSPILVLKDGRFHMSVGSPGGETIGQSQFQVIMNVLDFGMPVQEAVEAPRFALDGDFYRPGSPVELQVENRLAPDVADALAARGHALERVPGYSIGSNQALLRNDAGTITAGADPRRLQYAIGH